MNMTKRGVGRGMTPLRFRAWMRSNYYTERALATELGRSRKTIQNWKRGGTDYVTRLALERLATV